MSAAVAPSLYRVTPVRVLRSEWTKLWSLRSTWYTLGGVVLLTLALGAIIGATYTNDPQGPSDPLEVSLFGLNFAQLILPILGVLAAAGEWSTGMVRASMAAVPRRLPVLWAKAAVLGAVVFCLVLVTAFFTFLLAQLFFADTRLAAGLGDEGIVRGLFTSAAAVALCTVLGLALGALLRSIPAAIAVFVAVLMVLPSVAPLLPYAWVDDAVKYTPLVAAEPLMASTAKGSALGVGAALLTLVVWAAVSLGGAGLRLARSDV